MVTKQSAEYRREAVRVALTSGLMRKQVADDFAAMMALSGQVT